MEEKKKRQKKTYYFLAQKPIKFNSVKELEDWLTANGKKEEMEIIKGSVRQHKVIQHVKIQN